MRKKELEQYLNKNVEIVFFKGEVFQEEVVQGILYTCYDYFIRTDPDVVDYYKNKYCLSLPKRRFKRDFIVFSDYLIKSIREIEKENN